LTAKRVRIAKIGAAHGLRGEVRLFVDADDPLAVKKLGALEDSTGARQFKIASLREANDHLLVRFDGVSDRTTAERLTNIELYVPRDRFPQQKDKGRFYQADLVGLRVETLSGETLGKVVAVPNYGAGDLLEIAPAKGGLTFLLPFADPFVPEVDVAGGRIVIDPPVDFLQEPSRSGRSETES
jgi:16S rRNA processing protein RimM